MNEGAIIIVDDDVDDLELMKLAFQKMGVKNKITFFKEADKFLDFARSATPSWFFILCDVNMPAINGLELKKRIFEDEQLRLKCVPFIFLSTTMASEAILRAYSFGVQGYIKPNSLTGLKEMLIGGPHNTRTDNTAV